MEYLLLLPLFIFAFLFRYFRELEDEIIKGNHSNWSWIPNSSDAWTAKWKYPLETYKKKWYNLWTKPNYKERFPFSSTILVWVTDSEHLYQFIQTLSILGIVIFSPLVNSWWYAFVAYLSGMILASVIKEIVKGIN